MLGVYVLRRSRFPEGADQSRDVRQTIARLCKVHYGKFNVMATSASPSRDAIKARNPTPRSTRHQAERYCGVSVPTFMVCTLPCTSDCVRSQGKTSLERYDIRSLDRWIRHPERSIAASSGRIGLPQWSMNMTIVRVKGVKRYCAKGRWYAYHRKTGIRLKAEIRHRRFFAEMAGLERRLKTAKLCLER